MVLPPVQLLRDGVVRVLIILGGLGEASRAEEGPFDHLRSACGLWRQSQ